MADAETYQGISPAIAAFAIAMIRHFLGIANLDVSVNLLTNPQDWEPFAVATGFFPRAHDLNFEIAGRKWLVHFASLEPLEESSVRLLPRLVAFGGVMLSTLLFGIVLAQGRARATAEAGERRSQILANASRVFTAYPDEREAVQELTRFTVPYLADWCVISMFDGEKSELYTFDAVQTDSTAEKLLLDACRSRPSISAS